MLRWTLLLGLLAGTTQAATVTYIIEPTLGEFIDSEYGDRTAIRALYDEELRSNAEELADCQEFGLEGCETALVFEDTRVSGYNYANGTLLSFEEYYQLHTDAAGVAGRISTWQSGGLTIQVPSYGGFYPRGYAPGNLEFGYVLDGGDSDGPSNILISIPEDEVFVSIDLRVNPFSLGSINGIMFDAGFEGTYFFDSSFADSNLLRLGAGPLDPLGIQDVGYMFFDRIVTDTRTIDFAPAQVPLPGSLVMLGFGVAGLITVGRRRKKVA